MSEAHVPLEVPAGSDLKKMVAPAPNLLFTTHLWWEDRAKETLKHVAPPKFIGDGLIHFATAENIIVINSKYLRKAITSVEELPEENGHARIIQ